MLQLANVDIDRNLSFDQANREVAIKQKPQPNQQWKTSINRELFLGNIKGMSDLDVRKAVSNIQSSQPRQYEQSTMDEAIQFVRSNLDKAPQGLQRVLQKIFGLGGQNNNIAVNEDLRTAILKGFVKYQKKDGTYKTTLSLAQMYKAGTQASGYDKLVLLKARRIVKLLKQSISAYNMRADITLGKQYQAVRGFYNTSKLQYLPSARLNYARSLAKKIGPLTKQNYDNSLDQGLQRAVANINSNFVRWKTRNPETLIQQAQTPESVAQAKEFFKQNLKYNGAENPAIQQNFNQARQLFDQQQRQIQAERNQFNQQNFPQYQAPANQAQQQQQDLLNLIGEE